MALPVNNKTLRGFAPDLSSMPYAGKYERQVVEKHISQLPLEIQNGLMAEPGGVGKYQLEDTCYYETIKVGDTDKLIQLFKTTYKQVVEGISNIVGGKIPNGKHNLVMAISLEYSLAPDVTDVADAEFKVGVVPDEFKSGQLSINIDKKVVQELGLQVFSVPTTNNFTNPQMLYYVLANPKWVAGDKGFEGSLLKLTKALGTSGTDAHYMRISFYGVGINTTGGAIF
jgi:hypothetical protein